MVLSTKDKKARKAHNRDRRASTAAEKQAIALREACIPEARWPAPTASTAATGFSGVLYEGRPALVDPDMADDAEPVGFVHVKDYSEGAIPERLVIRATAEDRPNFYAVSLQTYRHLWALASLPPAPPARNQKVIDLPRGGIVPTKIEITGLGRGAVPSFKRAPNTALKHYLARNHITLKQYDAAMHLYYVFEDASIPPGGVLDPTRDFSSGGGWRDFTPARLDSHRRLEALFRAVDGKTGKLMAYDVCCLGKMLSEGSYGHFIDTRAKMARFREALDDLRAAYERAAARL